MMQNTVDILLLVDADVIANKVVDEVGNDPSKRFNVTKARNIKAVRTLIRKTDFDVLLVDIASIKNNLDCVSQLSHMMRDMAIITLCEPNEEGLALQTLKNGAQSYLIINQLNRQLLASSIDYAIERKYAQEAPGERKTRKNAVVESMPDAIITIDQDGILVEFNPAAERIFGYSRAAAIGQELAELIIPPAMRERHRRGLAQYLIQKKSEIMDKRLEVRALHADGTEFPIELLITPIKIKGRIMFIGYIRDITERKQTEQAIRIHAWRQGAVAELGQQALAGLDVATLMENTANLVAKNLNLDFVEILELLPNSETLLLRASAGWKLDHIGRTAILGGTKSPGGYALLSNKPVVVNDLNLETRFTVPELLLEHKITSGVSVIIHGRDRAFGVLSAYSRLARHFSHEDTHFLQVVANVLAAAVDRKRVEEIIAYQAYHDTLTGLPNRLMFENRLALALAQARRNQERLAVLFLDLDRFKTINDSLGHSIGDQLLKEVAIRLLTCVREGDTVARLGGDEFTLLLPNIEMLEVATQIPQRILDTLKPPFLIDDREIHISASIGISLYPHAGEDAATLLKHADTALYRAKAEGKNDYQHYSPAMDAKTSARFELENQLRTALERKEFKLHYQPQINLKTGKLESLEALVRWYRPEGMVLPEDFISLAEETGLIIPIGEWVLNQACIQSRRFLDGPKFVRIAVNLSARQFQQQKLVAVIDQILKNTNIPAQCLELELTESAVMHDPDAAIVILQALKDMGIRISIDDFGTGYSSLSYLKRFPIDTLKIDKSFVRDITTDKDDAAIVTAIILMAHSLGIKVVAEGVETKSQLTFLKEHDCDFAQGFYFSKPFPSDEFDIMLLHQAPIYTQANRKKFSPG